MKPDSRPDCLLAAAHGRTGRAVLQALVARGIAVRALIRSPSQAQKLIALGASDIAVGDLSDAESLERAAQGCSSAVYIGPPMHADEFSLAANFYEAARRAECSHFVYYSVLHPVCREIRHHRLKLEVEEAVVNGPLPFTIVQPARYMQHLEPLMKEVTATGVLSMPFDGSVKFNVVDLLDLAEAVAVVVNSPQYRFGTYELAGPEALSLTDMAATLGRLMGRPIAAKALPLETMRERAQQAGASVDRIEQMTSMNSHYNRHGMRGNPQVLAMLLDRAPTSFEFYAKRILSAL